MSDTWTRHPLTSSSSSFKTLPTKTNQELPHKVILSELQYSTALRYPVFALLSGVPLPSARYSLASRSQDLAQLVAAEPVELSSCPALTGPTSDSRNRDMVSRASNQFIVGPKSSPLPKIRRCDHETGLRRSISLQSGIRHETAGSLRWLFIKPPLLSGN